MLSLKTSQSTDVPSPSGFSLLMVAAFLSCNISETVPARLLAGEGLVNVSTQGKARKTFVFSWRRYKSYTE